jgi:hypothetical protein
MRSPEKAARLALSMLFVAALAACGGGGGAGSPPLPPATITSVTPGDAATAVNVQSTIRIVFDGAIDAASVTRANVRLFSWGVPVATQVTYDDATHAITVDPMGMHYARTYTLSISGLTSHGQAVAAKQAAFDTTINPATSGIYALTYQSMINGALGYVTDWQTIYSYDDRGRLTQIVDYSRPGPDGLWSSADDVVDSYQTQTFNDDGQMSTWAVEGLPGQDGTWFTSDDEVTVSSKQTFTAGGALLSEETFPMSSGNQKSYRLHHYAADGTESTATESSAAGADGIWGTADDTFDAAWTTSYDEFGHIVRLAYVSPGADGQWLTADDVVISYEKRSYRPDGRIDRIDEFSAGPDGIGLTSDDVLESSLTYDYDAAGNQTRVTSWNQGFVQGYTSTTYDAHNQRVSSVHYAGAGFDQAWFTADDQVDMRTSYDTSR